MTITRYSALAAFSFLLLFASCGTTNQMANPQTDRGAKTGPSVTAGSLMDIRPTGPAPDWAPDIDPQMHAVIQELTAAEPPKYPESTPFQVRNAILPTEAIQELILKTGVPPMAPKTDVSHKVIPAGPEEGLLVRMYKPLDAPTGNLPVLVYYHGGGWVIADLDTYDPSARALAAKTGAIVVSVAYRQAPEHTFPTAHEDAYAAYKWVTENAASFGGDPGRIATAGESAGGNLAVAVALMARDRGASLPAHILTVYPIADGDVQSPSYDKYAKAQPLNRAFMKWFFNHYQADWETNTEPLISLVDADLSGLPTTTIVNAQIDPLEAEGQDLAEALERAGVPVERRVYNGVTHEFFGMAAVLEQAAAAQDFAAGRLKADLATGGKMKQDTSGNVGMMKDLPRGSMVVSGGLRGPESAIYDASRDVYYVTNVNGQPGAKDDNGFISKVSPDGSIRQLKWIDGADRNLTLHAPKGLALRGNTLYVADIEGVHVFDVETGGRTATWSTPEAQFLNAVTVDGAGNVYATDSGIEFTNNGPRQQGNAKVYRWDPRGERQLLAQGEAIKGANGIAAQPDGSVVVASILGNAVTAVDRNGNTTTVKNMPGKSLDGLVRLADGSHIVTSWGEKTVYQLMPNGSTRVIASGLNSPADVHVDTRRNHVLIPLLMENKVVIVPLVAR